MALEMRFLDNGLGVLVVARGDVTEQEYLDFYVPLLEGQKAGQENPKYSITDYSEAESVEISGAAITRVAELSADAGTVNPSCVAAIVATRDLIFGLTRMWQMQNPGSDANTMIFRDRGEAEAWIRAKVAEIHGIEGLEFR